MLFRRDTFFACSLTLRQLRQAFVVVIHDGVVLAFFVDRKKAVKEHDLTRRAEHHLTIIRSNIGSGAFQARGGHLACHRALVDKVIELALIRVGDFGVFGGHAHFRRADAFVGFLRVFRFVLIHPRAVGQVAVAKLRFDGVAGVGHGLGRHVDAVGPHVGDEPRFIEPLRHAHRLTCAKAELAAGFLLQGRGHEGWGGVPIGGLRLHRFDDEVAAVDGLDGHFRLGLVADAEFFELFTREYGETCLICLATGGGELCLHAPIFLRAKRLDFHLALDKEAERDGLHTTGRAGARQLAPEHRREVEADEVIECTAGEVCLHQRLVDLPWIGHRVHDRRLGDRVKHDAADGGVFLDRFAGGQRFCQVPTDGFAFPIGVGGEDQFRVVFQGVNNRFDVLFAVACDLPFHGEVFIRQDRSIFWWQVADVSEGCKDGVIVPQISVYFLCFSRRFDDDDCHENP